MPHCSWFLPNAIFDYVHPYVHGFFRVLWSEAIAYIPHDRGV